MSRRWRTLDHDGAVDPSFWRDRRVLLTGHTGFKGSWLSLWLQSLGARVTGFSVGVPDADRRCTSWRSVGEGIEGIDGDVRDPEAVAAAVAKPSRRSSSTWRRSRSCAARSSSRAQTYETNVMGTVNVLDAVRLHGGDVRAIVNVTSDKCYENREWEWGYREHEPMGGLRSLLELQGLLGARDRRLPPLVLLSRRRAAPGLRSRGQRDRRRRLGRGPAGAGHHARGARRRAGARAQPELDPAVAARAQPAQRLSGAGPGAVGRAGARGGLELRSRRRGRAPGRLDRAADRRAVAGGSALGCRTTARTRTRRAI